MLIYSRIKSVGVQRQDVERRVVSGVLEDELYAMQCEMSIHWPTLTIESVRTRMKRFTTTECLRAQEIFPHCVGWRLGVELDSLIKKDLGRNGCRHMAALIVDCCRAVARAELAGEIQAARIEAPDTDLGKVIEAFYSKYPDLNGYLRHA